MKKYFNIIRKCQLFDGIDDNDLFKMLTCLGAKVIEFDKKYTIIAEQSKATYLGIVLSGSADVVQIDYYGNRSILAKVLPSEIFAEAFACAGVQAIPISVIANEPSVVCLIDCSHILHTCANNCGFHRQLIFNLMKILAEKNLEFYRRIEITSKRTTREKLLTYLGLEARRLNLNSFDIPFNRQDLADFLEVDRSGLSAEISKLREEGILKSRKNHFELL